MTNYKIIVNHEIDQLLNLNFNNKPNGKWLFTRLLTRDELNVHFKTQPLRGNIGYE